MVGDDIDEDYKSAKAAGLHAVLLRRDRHDADWVRRETRSQELEDVALISSLADLSCWIEEKDRKDMQH